MDDMAKSVDCKRVGELYHFRITTDNGKNWYGASDVSVGGLPPHHVVFSSDKSHPSFKVFESIPIKAALLWAT